MSAWWTSKRHVDLILTAGVALGVVSEDMPTSHGRLLRRDNAKSLENRYGDDMGLYKAEIEGYVFRPAPDENLVGVYCSLHSYDYQTCEMANYADSFAKAFVDALSKAIETKLGKNEDELRDAWRPYAHGENGYWSISEYPELVNS